MMEQTWEQIVQGKDLRQNLSKLRGEVKASHGARALLHHIAGNEEALTMLLKHEDAKTRKNTALLLGELRKKEYLPLLFDAYQAENQRFVKSSYLSVVKNFDYREYLDAFKECLNELSETTLTEENQKHIADEMRVLSDLIVTMEGVSTHRFEGYDESYDIILLTNRNFADVTVAELLEAEPAATAKVFGAGVMAKVPNLHWLRTIRTYQELLFMVDGMKTCKREAESAAETIAQSGLLDFLNKAHKGKAPYYFRIEIKSKMELDKKSAFAKKMSGQIERLTGRKLINTTSNYEFEIRLIENKTGNFNLLVKLYTRKDDRFSYRIDVIPTSMKPVNAALVMSLSRDYLKENARVLDPFCGVGTMLIERHKAMPVNTSYGVDLQEDAIEKARNNTEIAHQIIHYVNRDFFDFKHEYQFDEIITNMPFKIGRKTEEEIKELYQKFLSAAPRFLTEEGTVILYSHNRELVNQMAPDYGFALIKEYEISKKEGTYVLILKVQ